MKNTWIIDDDSAYTFLFKLTFKEVSNIGILSDYSNGQEGMNSLLNLIESKKPLPELIFLDLNMPVMDGWEFLERFSEIPEHIQQGISIYIASSSIDPRDMEKIKELKTIKGNIVKPVTLQDLDSILFDES